MLNTGNWTLVITCVALILFTTIAAPYLNSLNDAPEHFNEEGSQQTDGTANEPPQTGGTANEPPPQQTAVLPNPEIVNSNRQSIIELVIRNLYFMSVYPTMSVVHRSDIDNMYNSVKQFIKMDLSSFDVLCQNVTITNPALKVKLKENCQNFYINQFAQNVDIMYPSFDSTYIEATNTKLLKDNSVFRIDSNAYQISKFYYSPRFVRYVFDTIHSLIRIIFNTDRGISLPTYFLLSMPFAIEFDQLGIFNIVNDVNPQFNIMNNYDSDGDVVNKNLFLTPVPSTDSNGNKHNYLQSNNLNNITEILNSSTQYNQMKCFYTEYLRGYPNINSYNNTITVLLKNNSNGTFTTSYGENITSHVGTASIQFENRELSIRIDSVNYSPILTSINRVLSSPSMVNYHIYITMAFNVLKVVFMYKKNSFEHHVIIRRTNLLQNDMITPSIKTFKFARDFTSTINYVNANNNTFEIMNHIPNFLYLSQAHGYSFKT